MSPEEVRAADKRQCERERKVLRTLAFPVYAARGWPAKVGGWSASGSRTTEVSVFQAGDIDAERAPRLEVCTAADEWGEQDVETAARDELKRHLLEEGVDWPDASDEEISLWLSERERGARAAVARLEPRPVLLDVDGEPLEFALVESGSNWAAVRRHGELWLTISAERVPYGEVALERLTDPVARLVP